MSGKRHSLALRPQLWRGLGREPAVAAANLLFAWERAADAGAAGSAQSQLDHGAAAGIFAKRAWSRIQQLLPLLAASMQDCQPGGFSGIAGLACLGTIKWEHLRADPCSGCVLYTLHACNEVAARSIIYTSGTWVAMARHHGMRTTAALRGR